MGHSLSIDRHQSDKMQIPSIAVFFVFQMVASGYGKDISCFWFHGYRCNYDDWGTGKVIVEKGVTDVTLCEEICREDYGFECQFYAYESITQECKIYDVSMDYFLDECGTIDQPSTRQLSACAATNDPCSDVGYGDCSL